MFAGEVGDIIWDVMSVWGAEDQLGDVMGSLGGDDQFGALNKASSFTNLWISSELQSAQTNDIHNLDTVVTAP